MLRLRRVSFDRVILVLFVVVAGLTAWLSRPRPAAPTPSTAAMLARQIARIEEADAAKKQIELIPSPTTPEEAAATLSELQRCLEQDQPVQWEAFRAWIVQHGRPETVAAGDQVWNDYQQAAGALEGLLSMMARAAQPAEPAIELKQTDRYFELYNRFEEADDALDRWATRLSVSDFK